ncbi:glycosyltransferase [Maridesulfovibrio salexigens]|uniref:Glycosyl transferase group 1 n=1 Tax=Maridesulfovibrio salexigens (strain ATCC 14822 / DSM 2638 / NCIMB 8403 / VKM B-1763) TaxID=526222 RepID=C6BTJ1_MARSD|nr:glycosyltransferase [Maridesulfovibrio salexigens]ACS81672.1 glycosyl transferase group 1 [Maridesulfovibrio salexigens DSM 2638]
MNSTLLVIITDRLSHIIGKGELIDRYYNPGGVFSDVHILMTNDDRPDIQALQRTVGDAKLTLHTLPSGMGLLAKTLWRPFLLRSWADQAVELAREINPAMIRCYGNFLNGYVGARIKEELGIPLFVSLHTQPDQTRANPEVDFKTKVFYALSKGVEKYTLTRADKVSCVYGSILDYARDKGATNPFVAYNVINPGKIVRKEEYSSSGPMKILYVGRVIPAKNPENIIRALKYFDAELTIVGSGSKEQELAELANELKLNARIHFIPAMPNDELCRTMHEYDLFAGHSQYSEFPKTVLEASLCGLPILFNSRRGTPVPEFENNTAKMVEDSPAGYRSGIEFFSSEARRKEFGINAARQADAHWEPAQAEKIFADIHRELTGK